MEFDNRIDNVGNPKWRELFCDHHGVDTLKEWLYDAIMDWLVYTKNISNNSVEETNSCVEKAINKIWLNRKFKLSKHDFPEKAVEADDVLILFKECGSWWITHLEPGVWKNYSKPHKKKGDIAYFDEYANVIAENVTCLEPDPEQVAINLEMEGDFVEYWKAVVNHYTKIRKNICLSVALSWWQGNIKWINSLQESLQESLRKRTKKDALYNAEFQNIAASDLSKYKADAKWRGMVLFFGVEVADSIKNVFFAKCENKRPFKNTKSRKQMLSESLTQHLDEILKAELIGKSNKTIVAYGIAYHALSTTLWDHLGAKRHKCLKTDIEKWKQRYDFESLKAAEQHG